MPPLSQKKYKKQFCPLENLIEYYVCVNSPYDFCHGNISSFTAHLHYKGRSRDLHGNETLSNNLNNIDPDHSPNKAYRTLPQT